MLTQLSTFVKCIDDCRSFSQYTPHLTFLHARYNVYKRVLTIMKRVDNGELEKVKLQAVFLPKPIPKVFNKMVNRLCGKRARQELCDDIFDSQGSLHSIFSQDFDVPILTPPTTPSKLGCNSSSCSDEEEGSQLPLSQVRLSLTIGAGTQLSPCLAGLSLTQASPPARKKRRKRKIKKRKKNQNSKRLAKLSRDVLNNIEDAWAVLLARRDRTKDGTKLMASLTQAFASAQELDKLML